MLLGGRFESGPMTNSKHWFTIEGAGKGCSESGPTIESCFTSTETTRLIRDAGEPSGAPPELQALVYDILPSKAMLGVWPP